MKNTKLMKKKSGPIGVIILAAAAALSAFLRLWLGVELTDEAFAAADALLVAGGAVPFADIWMTTGFSAFAAPAVRLFLELTGSTEGLILFLRLLELGIKAAMIALLCVLLRKKVAAHWVLAASLFLLPLDYINLQTVSYTQLSLQLLLTASGCLAAALFEEEGSWKNAFFAALGGLLAAVCAFVYPPQVVTCALLAGCLVAAGRNRHFLRPAVWFTVGGLVTTVLVTGVLCLMAGGVEPVVQGLWNSMALRPAVEGKPGLLANLVTATMKTGAVMLVWATLVLALMSVRAIRMRLDRRGGTGAVKAAVSLLPACGCVGFLFLCVTLKPRSLVLELLPCFLLFALLTAVLLRSGPEKGWKRPLKTLCSPRWCAVVFWIAYPLTVLYTQWHLELNELAATVWQESVIALCVPPCLAAPLLLKSVAKKHPWSRDLFLALWVPSVLWLATAAILTDSFATRCIALTGSVVCAALLFFLFLEDQQLLSTGRNVARVCTGWVLVLCAGLSLYSFVYRDAPAEELTTPVTEGVYRGLRTTPERAEGIMELERELREQVGAGEKVLFLDNVPMAYLMTDGIPWTPTCWNGANYSNGCNDDRWYLTYFETAGAIPDKIVYVDTRFTGNYDQPLSIDAEGYRFNKFVEANYMRVYESGDDAVFPVRVFARR